MSLAFLSILGAHTIPASDYWVCTPLLFVPSTVVLEVRRRVRFSISISSFRADAVSSSFYESDAVSSSCSELVQIPAPFQGLIRFFSSC